MEFGDQGAFIGGSMGPSMSEMAAAGGGGYDWGLGDNDQAIWATEDEYSNCYSGGSVDTSSNYNSGTPGRSGMEPPSKKSRNSQSGDSAISRSKAIGRMFFKTKLCCKFRAGVCPYVTNCNFAHGIEELRKPPPNWQDIVAAHEEDRGIGVEHREEHQIPTITPTEVRSESQRSYKGRHCKKFYTEEGCPYGDNCTFLHDEQSRARESVAISVSPTVGGGYGATGVSQKPSNWKTRICNKWETTGNCPFGSKCHFAHGLAELHKFGGGLAEGEGGRDFTGPPESKQGSMMTKSNDTVIVGGSLGAPRSDFHYTGVASQRGSTMVIQAPRQRAIHKWKGPDKISKIYGDWIDDIE